MKAPKPKAKSKAKPKGRQPLKVGPSFAARTRAPVVSAAEAMRRAAWLQSLFKPAQHPPEATPPEPQRMQMATDSGSWGGAGYSQQAIWSAYAEGQEFLGYPTLALMAQRGEYRTIVRVLASAMTRKWVRIKSGKDDGSSQNRINELDAYMKKLRVRQHFKRAAELDFYFGRGHLFLEFGGTNMGVDPEETKHSVGWGDDEQTRLKVGPACRLTRIKPVEPVWAYPMSYNTNDPLSPTWYLPEDWFVMGKQVHATRLLRFVMDEVSDLLKPAYSFGGLSKQQIVKPYVDNWLNARQAVADILKGFTTYVLGTNLIATLRDGSAQDLMERIQVFVNTRDNSGLMAIDSEEETFDNVSVPLGGLDRLQSQSLEFICCVAQLPLVYFTGITPSGLNPSSRDEMLVFNETIKSMQEVEFEDNLRVVFNHCQMSLWGEVDDDLDFEFLPLIEMTEIEKSQKRQIDSAVDQIYIEGQVVTPEEVRDRLAHDPDSPYPGLKIENQAPDDQEDDEPDPWDNLAKAFGVEKIENPDEGRDPFSRLPEIMGHDDLGELAMALDAPWKESDHPRGQPGNPGQFVAHSGGGSTAEAKKPPAKAGTSVYNMTKNLPDFVKVEVKKKLGDMLGINSWTAQKKAVKIAEGMSNEKKVELAAALKSWLHEKYPEYKHLMVAKPKIPFKEETEAKPESPPPEAKPESPPPEAKPESPPPSSSPPKIGTVAVFGGKEIGGAEGFHKYKKGTNTLFVKQDDSWILYTPGHNTKQGPDGVALKALLEGGDWHKKGVTNYNGSLPAAGITESKEPSPTEVSHETKVLKKIAAARPEPSPSEAGAISGYKDGGYGSINGPLREKRSISEKAKLLTEWLDRSKLPEDVTLYRGVNSSVGTVIKAMGFENFVFADHGFSSTSTSEKFSKGWGGGGNLLMVIKAKKGQKGAAIRASHENDSEHEVLLQRGSKFKVTKLDLDNSRIVVELIQEALE